MAFYIHSITDIKYMRCSRTEQTAIFIDIVCIVLLLSLLFLLLQPLLLLLFWFYFYFTNFFFVCSSCRRYWFCFIIFFLFVARSSRMNQDHLVVWECGLTYGPVFMCRILFFLVRFINDVTFNICETWAQNQFLMRIIIPCGLFALLPSHK